MLFDKLDAAKMHVLDTFDMSSQSSSREERLEPVELVVSGMSSCAV